jgi:predicted nucleic acid-binding protein
MTHLFLDTNILIDLIADRQPFSKHAIAVFKLKEENKIVLYTSSHSIATTHYLMKKYLSESALNEVISSLLDFLIVLPVDVEVLKRALLSKTKDFEDAIQIVCAAKNEQMNFIITRNLKDFKQSSVKAISPDEFLNLYLTQKK